MKCYFLQEDLWAYEAIANDLRRQLKELGKEQGEVARQSTENMGHDDACQESVEHARQIVVSRLRDLQRSIGQAMVVHPKGPFTKVHIGTTVELSDGRTYKIGSFMIFADHGVPTISYASPLAKALMFKKAGDEVNFQGNHFSITRVS